MEVNIRYFAILKEQAKKKEEFVRTKAKTARELFSELSQKYQFSLGSDQIRVSINEEYRDLNSSLRDGDRVVFIPPVAGG